MRLGVSAPSFGLVKAKKSVMPHPSVCRRCPRNSPHPLSLRRAGRRRVAGMRRPDSRPGAARCRDRVRRAAHAAALGRTAHRPRYSAKPCKGSRCSAGPLARVLFRLPTAGSGGERHEHMRAARWCNAAGVAVVGADLLRRRGRGAQGVACPSWSLAIRHCDDGGCPGHACKSRLREQVAPLIVPQSIIAIASISTIRSGCDSRRTSTVVLVGSDRPKISARVSGCLKNSSMSVT